MNASSDALHENRSLVSRLQQSDLYRSFADAFQTATGLPLDLRPAGSLQASYRHSRQVNPFCALLARTNKTCAACLQLQQRVEDEAVTEAMTLECYAGLSESAVPLRIGERVVAYLQTGQVLLHRPSKSRFRKAVQGLIGKADARVIRELEKAYLETRVMSRTQYDSMVRLLSIFAQQLAAFSNQLMVQAATAEQPVVTRARQYIESRHSEELALADVARACGMSAFYFCKTFKKATGLTFTHYLARVRLEKVKTLLLNPHTRISEAAFAAGFQSLSQFNRVFLRLAGEAPSAYRERIHGAALAAA